MGWLPAGGVLLALVLSHAYNLDSEGVITKRGPTGGYFGYSVASHFNGSIPIVLVGAPRAESGQRGTVHAGALFACPISSFVDDCTQYKSEYYDPRDYSKKPDQVDVANRPVYYLGKNKQLFGASISSQAVVNGSAVVCAPLMSFHNTSAFVNGACYKLNSDLTLTDVFVSCPQEGLSHQERHNDYGACIQGHSSFINQEMLVTGVLGAKKWTGGVFAVTNPRSLFDSSMSKYTMAADTENSLRGIFRSHDYVGFSVGVGRFGFAHENGEKQTIVAGATRFGQHGAVVVLPFNKESKEKNLFLTDDKFYLNGTQLGSGFGYSLQVLDLNNDGFDDLLVGAPFERHSDESGVFGGAVYVFFSSGVPRDSFSSSLVFLPPVILRQSGILSQFGLAIASLGNIDGDYDGYQDFAVGAPFAEDGAGSVFIFHGAASPDKLSRTAVQVLLPQKKPSRAFGFSLSGNVDLDGNGYPDLVVGTALSDTVAIFRSRPVIRLETSHRMDRQRLDMQRKEGCPRKAATCFKLTLNIKVGSGDSTKLINLNSDVFNCTLEVLEWAKGVTRRALIDPSERTAVSWPCGKNSHRGEQAYDHIVFIPKDDPSEDWLNPLRLRFTVALQQKKPDQVEPGRALPDLSKYPMLDELHATHEFEVAFNTRCGSDEVCQSDLSVSGVLDGISKEGDVYVSNVGDKEHLDVSLLVRNNGEKAYGSSLWFTFDPEELESPSLERKKKKNLVLENVGDNVIHIKLGNPMDSNQEEQLTIRFKLIRGRTQGLGRPLSFHAYVNSSSEETNPENNEWEAQLKIIKRVDLELIGTSDPPLVRFGGEVKKVASMDLEEDIGVMVRHNYTLHNRGNWTVRNIRAEFRWPMKVRSRFSQDKYALYLLDVPTATTYHSDGSVDIRPCTIQQPVTDYVNPEEIKRNTGYSTIIAQPIRRREKRSPDVPSQPIASAGLFADRVDPVKRKEGDVEVDVVSIGCEDETAVCFSVTCLFDFIDANSAPVIDFRSRLWNSTFVQDYSDIEYVEIISWGRIEVDPQQGLEDDPSNNQVHVKTLAYPDKPSIDESRPIPWWIYIVAVLAGILILLLLSLLLWKCGFFKRKRPQPNLYTAQLHHERELWAEQ